MPITPTLSEAFLGQKLSVCPKCQAPFIGPAGGNGPCFECDPRHEAQQPPREPSPGDHLLRLLQALSDHDLPNPETGIEDGGTVGLEWFSTIPEKYRVVTLSLFPNGKVAWACHLDSFSDHGVFEVSDSIPNHLLELIKLATARE